MGAWRALLCPLALACFADAPLLGQEPGPTQEPHPTRELHPVRQLTDDPAQQGFPSWSPDGTTIVHSSYVEDDSTGVTGLWLVPVAGGEPRQLTTFIGEHPDWSPDGRYIVFDAEFGDAIKLVAASGGQPIRIVPPSIPVFRGGNSNWSPDGTHIAFKEGSNLWVLDVRTGDARIVLSEPGRLSVPGCWSPDGSDIYLWSREEASRESAIWAVSTTGDERRLVASDSRHVYRYMDVSPDGSLLAFASAHEDNVDLWIMSTGGGAPIRITSHPEYDDTPRWSPDGRQIAFTSTRSGSFDVWIMELDLEVVRSALRAANP